VQGFVVRVYVDHFSLQNRNIQHQAIDIELLLTSPPRRSVFHSFLGSQVLASKMAASHFTEMKQGDVTFNGLVYIVVALG
jgi:hypothetical protein